MYENINSNEILFQLSELSRAALGYKAKTIEAKKHLERGINFRYILLQDSVLLLHEGINNLENNRYEIGKINVAINSIYINIRGIIDNIAWVLYFDFIKEKLNHNSISFTNKKYLSKLVEANINIESIMQFNDWFSDLSKKRDPIAHRLPLYIPPKVITSKDEASKAQEYLDKACEYLKTGNMQEWNKCLEQSREVGQFIPVIMLDNVDTMTLKPIGLNIVLKNDFEMLTKFTCTIFDTLKL